MPKNSGRFLVPISLVLGGILGMAGTLVDSVPLRGLLWGLDGIGLIVAATV